MFDSVDPDASWTNKGNKYSFGYKVFVSADMEDGYIDEIHVTPANVSECTQLKQVIEHCKPNQRIFTDKGYAQQIKSRNA